MAKVDPELPREGVNPADDGPMARVLAVIETVAFAQEPVALKDVEEKTGLPKPTVHRILGQLERMGYLQRAIGPKNYFPGSRLAALSLAAVRNRWSHHESHKILSDLVARLGETCNLTVLDGYEVLIVDRVETHWPLRFVMQVNQRFQLHNTSRRPTRSPIRASWRRCSRGSARMGIRSTTRASSPAWWPPRYRSTIRRDR